MKFVSATAMVQFSTAILKFAEQGEKTGWTYIEIAPRIALQLKPGNKKSFRVKGKLDAYSISGISLLPMGGGAFIMPLNARIRKGIGKRNGAMVKVQLTEDKKVYQLNADFMECLADEPAGMDFFKTIPRSFQNYFSKWIETAKTEQTKAKRIAQAVTALSKKQNFTEMMRSHKLARQERMH